LTPLPTTEIVPAENRRQSGWEAARVGEVLRIEHGFAFRGEYFLTSGSDVLLTPKNFRPEGGLDVAPARCKYYDGPIDQRFVLKPGDIVVAMTDLKQDAPILGAAGVIPSGRRFLHNQRIGRVVVVDPARIAPEFVPWLLNSEAVRQRVRATATGATVKHTAPTRIAEAEIRLPPLATQRRIAAVLAAFGELIATNDRRIELLDGLVRSLYREWFVQFRLPKQANEFVDSELGPIPKGWAVARVGEVATLRYGKALPARDRLPGPYPVVSSAGVIGRHAESLASGPGIVIGRKGNVGSVWWVDESFFPIDTTYYVESRVPLGLLYWQLRHLTFIDSHAAVPGLSREQAATLLVLDVDRELAERFDAFHRTCFELMGVLRTQNRTLAATRELLLPRLMAGSLDISAVDLGALLSPEGE
jgi:type I restriction enzyme S subunit